jgi:hypothetical protein
MSVVSLKPTDRILILGENGTGKTYLARRLLSKAPRVVVFTPYANEWTEYPNRIVGYKAETFYETIHRCLKTGNVLLAGDDEDLYLDRYADDDRLRYLLVGGRHRGIGWVCISRRTADLPPLYFKTANKVFLFQTDLPRDVELFDSFYACGKEVKTLNRAQYGCLFVDREAHTKTPIVAQ